MHATEVAEYLADGPVEMGYGDIESVLGRPGRRRALDP